MTPALNETAVARIAYNLQQLGWMVGRAYETGYDLLAYSPKHYRICGIKVIVFDITGKRREVDLKRQIDGESLHRCTHIAVYVEPKGWIYLSSKDNVIEPDGSIRGYLSPAGESPDGKEKGGGFGRFRDAWDELLRS